MLVLCNMLPTQWTRGRVLVRSQTAAIRACEIGAEDQRQIERLGDGFDAADPIYH
jgi:hypothetical protein